MTLFDDSHTTPAPVSLVPRHRPGRQGQPWTDEDYEHLITLVREGHGIFAMAEALGRSEGAVANRLRALLPPDQRSCLGDRVLPTLRTRVQEQPDYPWAEIMVQFPPPPPVVTQVVRRDGIAGLEDDDLLELVWALLHCETSGSDTERSACLEVRTRGLEARLIDRLADALVRRLPPLTLDEASYAAFTRFDVACGRDASPWRGSGRYGDERYW